MTECKESCVGTRRQFQSLVFFEFQGLRLFLSNPGITHIKPILYDGLVNTCCLIKMHWNAICGTVNK